MGISLTGYNSSQEILDLLANKEAEVIIKIFNQEYTIKSVLPLVYEEGFIKKKTVTDYKFNLAPIYRTPFDIEKIEGVKVSVGTILNHDEKKYIVDEINKQTITAKIVETELENLQRRVAELESKLKNE